MKELFTALCVLLVALQQSTAQDVQIDGKAFQTVKKSVLNAEIEYYQVKEKANAASKSQSYIKRGGEFTKTVFSEAELKRFVSTGKASSFGVIKEKQLSKKNKITYIIKSNILVLISKSKNTLKFLEVHDKDLAESLLGGDKVVKSDETDGPGPNQEGFQSCSRDCSADFLGNLDEGGNNGGCLVETVGDAIACEAQFSQCMAECRRENGIPNKPGDFAHLYAITLKGLAVSIK